MPRFTSLILTIPIHFNCLLTSSPRYPQHYLSFKNLTTMSQPQSHTHDHPHGDSGHDHDQHQHDAQATFAKANAEHYNTEKAKKYDNNPFFQRFGKNLAETITKVYPFDKDSTKVLDYACGTGTLSSLMSL